MSWFRSSPPAPAPVPAPARVQGRLFDPAFLARLERLHLLSRRRFGGQHRAERRSRKMGSSLEFADYRNYSVGDDLRNIDWNIYGRLDKLFLKLFEEEEDLPIYLLLDVSASMRWTAGNQRPSKLDLARQIAAALAYIGLAGLDRVNLHYFSSELGRDLGSGRGKMHFHRVRDFLSQVPQDDTATDLARSLGAFSRRVKQRGLAIVLSDFFDPRGYEEALGMLLYSRFEVQVIQVLDPAELNPRLGGDVRLTNPETAQAYEVTVNESLARAYEREINGFIGGLETFCRQRRAGYRRAMTDVSCEDFILRELRKGDAGLLR